MAEWKSISQKGVIVVSTIGDGNCFFHAIIQGFLPIYNEGYSRDGSAPLDKRDFISNLRKDLAENLSKKKPNTNKTWYEYLSRGKLKDLGKELPVCNLENMKSMLNSNKPVDNLFHEYVSEFLGIDIYILDLSKKDVYKTGEDSDILHKNRRSVVVGYSPGHYSTVGVKYDNTTRTSFDFDHPFIVSIKKRLNNMTKN
jgi:hypothetical protein